ncbi:MAG: 4-hydroxythreonine-4-phosphate dehydrogenase PdxA [Pseudobdellovibrionaceae bacterium]|nr:4-hydroxythreonine-4-phosphate dehydrogenase PdxA [Pseudobdellovibrionaceae bacterium]
MKKKVLVTTGDPDGIGLEVFLKALTQESLTESLKSVAVVLWCADQEQILKKNFTSTFNPQKIFSVSHPNSANVPQILEAITQPGVYFILDSRNPALWVQDAALHCNLNPSNNILVTGPLDKTTIRKAGFSSLGHTGLLAHVTNTSREALTMFFHGEFFNVVLLTDHISISNVEHLLVPSLVEKKLNALWDWSQRFYQLLGYSEHTLFIEEFFGRFLWLGVNPHNGESGLISFFDQRLFSIIPWKKLLFAIGGPIVPDTACVNYRVKGRTTFIANYHDQGLIPFKMAHGFSGSHFTAGLPFLRISVDHGTAKDIFGKNIADPSSALSCLRWALR